MEGRTPAFWELDRTHVLATFPQGVWPAGQLREASSWVVISEMQARRQPAPSDPYAMRTVEELLGR